MEEIRDPERLEEVLGMPLAIIFKHSTQCPISIQAEREVSSFLQVHARAPVFLVDVLQSRLLSQEIERSTGIKHESPQVIVLQDGRPAWHASHYDVTAQELEQATVDFK